MDFTLIDLSIIVFKMTTPIYDFVKKYSESGSARFHMPGHKGRGELGCEALDITEISGADVLYSAEGIIAESENNLTALYGTSHSFYSTEGSTLAIKAMLALISERAGDERPLILAARNVHASFVRAVALLDLDVKWIYPCEEEHLCRCVISPRDIQIAVESSDRRISAVYITSPDYLGTVSDIRSLAKTCKRYGIPLLVDNAHGAYLKFLPEDMHPITLGAAMCADSAHKTLPVLTGGAYLHISRDYPEYVDKARAALSLFASTSPSYLTLSSLDLCNRRLCEDYPKELFALIEKTALIKHRISSLGFTVCESEPLKIVLRGEMALASHLRGQGIEPEFDDSEYLVLMLTPSNSDSQLEALASALSCYEGEKKVGNIGDHAPKRHTAEMSIRKAILSPFEIIPTERAEGRICATPTVSCPPAVPIVISGERITGEDVKLFKYYGIKTVSVVK